MIDKVLIANRGEIAVRIIRACHEMGIETVGVYSKADEEQLHVKLADEAYCIGDADPTSSYLNIPNILSVATLTGCDAIHPGYGFLSENVEFVRLVKACGLIFIGPSAQTIEQMGHKSRAIETMKKAGVPTVPGSEGTVDSLEEAQEICGKIGYPVLLKAAAGGGGRGMRRVFSEQELGTLLDQAKREAMMCFGNDDMYIEKLVLHPRHIEFQILADQHGNTVHLGDRECSIQRKNQKMLEESPSPFLDEVLRREMGDHAVLAAKACNYVNAGTIEFIVDHDKNYYFIEMNTRVQVEHPVTEMVTGIDIIREQLRIASGYRLGFAQEDIQIQGHAIECRVNAESPAEGFRPSAGPIVFLHLPGGFSTRFDTYLYQGCQVSPFYDSMLGKLIVHAKTRLEAIRRMRRAIEETLIEGVDTNIGYQYTLLHDLDFVRGRYHTGTVEQKNDRFLELMERV